MFDATATAPISVDIPLPKYPLFDPDKNCFCYAKFSLLKEGKCQIKKRLKGSGSKHRELDSRLNSVYNLDV